MRTLVLLLLGAVLLAGLPADAKPPHRRCDFPWRQSTKAKTQVIRCWAEVRGLPVEKVEPIPVCEAGPDRQDRYRGDGRAGPWQYPDYPDWDVADVWLSTKTATAALKRGEWSRWAQCL